MNYKINITSIAEQDIDSIVFYLLEHLKNCEYPSDDPIQ